MARYVPYLLMLSSLMAVSAEAAYEGPEQSSKATTAAAALHSKDDTMVELTGNIVKSLGDEKYLFRDKTGEIEVEIENSLWRHIIVTEATVVKLRGELDDKWQGKEVEIDSISIITANQNAIVSNQE
ncbi:NirD/YgiW/YdeI family stress tolerance protein [Shewanella marina]|uniref:NirD/YgiW/YdeI family stress tolerance protein n=1 Tax=Shewanella marina TaxID=487319 RepID=UPI000470866E|nr:NirD/YgiW/YdeI family stress tolerance protein [Shewanella marina]